MPCIRSWFVSGKMTNRCVSRLVYREGNMPVEMVRLALNGQKVRREYRTSWKFYGALGDTAGTDVTCCPSTSP